MKATRYVKPEAVRQLERQEYMAFCLAHPKMPAYAVPKPKHRDDTANGLTKCVITYIRLNGGQAERINTTGVPEQIGGVIRWRRSTSTRGSADISATIHGRSVKVEVKIGHDRMSDAQRQYAETVRQAGGLYVVACNFTEFVQWYKKTFALCVRKM